MLLFVRMVPGSIELVVDLMRVKVAGKQQGYRFNLLDFNCFYYYYYFFFFGVNIRLIKTTYHKKHGADRVCFTHHPSSVICSTKYNLDSTGGEFLSSKAFYSLCNVNYRGLILAILSDTDGCSHISFFLLESLRYLSMYDNRILRYFKGHKERFESHHLLLL